VLEDLSNQATVVDAIKAGNFKLILAIGTQAALLAKTNFPNLPIVFCLVVDAPRIGLKADNITGVSLNVPIKEQFAVLRSINKRITRVGVIYTQPINEGLITSAREAADNEKLTLIVSPISSRQDIQKALTDLLGKCDALWIPPDPSLNSEEVIKYIGSTSLAKQIPCIGPSDRYVRSGAVFSLSVDAVESGRAAGELCNKILQGTSPSNLPIQTLLKPRVILNMKAAGLLGLTIPKNLQDAASKIYQ
jgi:putative ABC transport system substrate-binding protein